MFSVMIDGIVPSVNKYYRHTRDGRHYISQEGKAFKERLGWMARAKKVECTDQPVELVFIWYCKKGCRGGDIDNRLKVILDALEGIVYKNDKQVVKITAQKVLNAGVDGARIEVVIS